MLAGLTVLTVSVQNTAPTWIFFLLLSLVEIVWQEWTIVRRGHRLAEETQARLKAEEALVLAETRKALVLESALEGIITIDDRRQTFEYNRAARDIFGYSREEVIGRDLTDLIVPARFRADHDTAFMAYLHAGAGHHQGRPMQVTGRRKSGEEFPA